MHTPIAGPHTHANAGTARIMLLVCASLLPATAYGFYLFGWPAILLFTVTVASAVLCETASLLAAGKSPGQHLSDGSALLTGWLLALTLPPWAPWWLGVIGAMIAIVVGKHVFGGLGQNLFNPAMLARVTLLISFPLEMTTWARPAPLFSAAAPGLLQSWLLLVRGPDNADAVSGATVLGHVRTEFSRGIGYDQAVSGYFDGIDSLIGHTGGSLGETSAALLLAGGLFLLRKRIIDWQIPVAMFIAVLLPASVFHLLDPQRYADPLFHLLSGGLILGALFIATDPVTSPSTPAGRLLFGSGCGLLTYVIRTWGGYPEGVGFAVLLMNACTPLIDHYIRPRIYGRNRRGAPLPLHTASAKTAGEEPKP